MKDVTTSLTTFREAARHVWNTAFVSAADWNARDRFSRVCVALFEALVLAPHGLQWQAQPQWWAAEPEPEPLRILQVVPAMESGIAILVNRQTPRCGYWDDPVRHVKPSEARLEFVRFFDFGELGPRDFSYVEVHIAAFHGHPELTGRRALLEYPSVRILTP